jgi:hypothetical protein
MIDSIISLLTWGYVPEITTVVLPTYILIETNKRDNKSLKNITSLYTGLGVTFTFIGIYKGLQAFDPTQIAQSLPSILDSFKTSFSTSIVGMASCMFVSHWIDNEYPLKDSSDHLARWLDKKLSSDQKFHATQNRQLDTLSSISLEMANQSGLYSRTNDLLQEIIDKNNDQWHNLLIDVVEKLDDKIETRLKTILESLTFTTSQMLEIVGENHQFQQKLIDDRETQMIASHKMAENSVKASEGFKSLVESYLRMEKNATTTGIALEQVADLGVRAKSSSQSMNEFMKTFNDHFTEQYNQTIAKATEQQAEYLVNVVATILDRIEKKVG